MADTWDLGLEKLTAANLANFIEMMGNARPVAKTSKKELLKKVYAELSEAFIEASDTIDTVKPDKASDTIDTVKPDRASDTIDTVDSRDGMKPGSSKDVKASDTIDPLPSLRITTISGAEIRAAAKAGGQAGVDAMLKAKLVDKKDVKASDTIDEKAKRQDEKGIGRDEVVIIIVWFIILIISLLITLYY